MPDERHPYIRPRELAQAPLECLSLCLQHEPPFYEKKFEFLLDYNEALRETICRLIDFEPHIVRTTEYTPSAEHDFRETIRPKHEVEDPEFRPVPYYQVFQEKHGFLPNLSIIDLLFNMGPESLLILQRSISSDGHVLPTLAV